MLWQIWIPVAVATAILAVQRLRRKYKPSYDLPVVGSPTDRSLAEALVEGYQKYPESAFVVPSDPPRVILPMKLHQEVIHAPESELSFAREIYEIFLGKYTHLGEPRHEVGETVRGDLTRNLTGILPPIQEEVKHAMKQMVAGGPEDWKSANAYHLVLRLVALMSGRVFVGLPLSRDEEWIKASTTFTTDVAKCRMAALEWNPWVRPWVLPFLPEVRHMRRALQRANEWMKPVVDEVLRNESALEEKPAKPGAPGAFVSWMMKHTSPRDKTSEHMGINQMLLSFAAIHTTSSTATLALYDLLGRPEYIGPLREEVEQVIAQDGAETDENGHVFLSKASLGKLKKLDSFIKESQRMSPLSLGGTSRRLEKDRTFSNGLKLPAGTPISFPLWGVYNSSSTNTFSADYNDGTGNAPPTEFDGFRFARLRERPGSEMKHQAATTGPDAFNFGHGPHACPGRFFAVYVIKCILVELLLGYDVRLKGRGDGEGAVSRPPNVIKHMIVNPDFTREVEFRKRQI
ncbi:cytochrome P450 [Colletotrichum zoysiae]|uniref:Cytochrome P450 n=1 Tax=Colletotrichum zoysiae TaxID=1216348 RepID=A0AAD9HEH5_9PEZI|nr:cytochrome P450 [Colletotrichum zoysiae]